MDKHWELIEEVYRKGWESKGQTDYDPRGTTEWQAAVDAFDVIKQRLAAAEAKIPDKPLGVFSEGVWVFATTAQTFTAEDLDIAAFVKYRDHMKGGE